MTVAFSPETLLYDFAGEQTNGAYGGVPLTQSL